MNQLKIISAYAFMFILAACGTSSLTNQAENEQGSIQPFKENPKYWQYKGEPVLLLGGTKNDNLYQNEGVREHLDELVAAGGNYIRNTMASRDSGDVYPYALTSEGKYNLNEWNEVYWHKFASLLELSDERDIIVQIEVWDRFDYSMERWDNHPFNPLNNVNYSVEDSILDTGYPDHPVADAQPFFHTIPGMPLYTPQLDRIRGYQEKYIDKFLSYTLNYGNVLYCMNNETTTPVAWGNYWIDYIRGKAKEKGVEVYLTDMYDHFFKVSSCEECKDLIAQPDYYTFMDISQINSRNFGQAHWDTLQTILDMRNQYKLRPVNNTKIYGGGNFSFGTGTEEDGIERFCRNIIGGCASARHHRPPFGNGLNDKAKASFRAVRNVEKYVPFWNVTPAMDLLTNREPNEAYIAAQPGESYILYFTQGGNVTLDLKTTDALFEMKWISLKTGDENEESQSFQGGKAVEIAAPNDEGWFAVLIKNE